MIRRVDINDDIELKGSTYTNGLEAIKISINQALRLFLGEYFMNRTIGVAYTEVVLIKNANQVMTEALLRDTILKVQGVDKVLNLKATINNQDRTMLISFTVSTVSNGNLTVEELDVGIR